MSEISNLYLFSYNSLQAFGWAISLFKVLSSLLATKSFHAAYAFAGEQLRIFQGLALLEIIHGAIGIVPNGPFLPLVQLAGRIHCLHATLCIIDEIQDSPIVFVMFVAWCLTEIIRYVYYVTNCVGIDSPLLTYIRYSAFIVLYPIGVAGEIWLTYLALPYYKKNNNMYPDFFAHLPLSYYGFALYMLVTYPAGWLVLYGHMLKQRRLKLFKKPHLKKEN
ncbi:hypothetical protein LguiB_031240 [Lonicera macranthoides]